MYIPPTRRPSAPTFQTPSDTLIHPQPPDGSLLPQRDPLAATHMISILSSEFGITTQLDSALPKTFTMTAGIFPATSSTTAFLARRGLDLTQLQLAIPISGATLLIGFLIMLLKQRWDWKNSLRGKETAPPIPPWVDRSWRSLRSQESLNETDCRQLPQSAVAGNSSDFQLEESSSLGGLETVVNTSDGGYQRASLSILSYGDQTLVNPRSSFYPSLGAVGSEQAEGSSSRTLSFSTTIDPFRQAEDNSSRTLSFSSTIRQSEYASRPVDLPDRRSNIGDA